MMRWQHRSAGNVISATAAATALGALVTGAAGCAGPAAGAATSSPARAAAPRGAPVSAAAAEQHGAPLSAAVARRLPAGYFYFLVGSNSNPGSGNLWQVTRSGQQKQLTHNKPGYGISSFGASPAGIVMADAARGDDQIARVTRKGVQFLKGRMRGSDPGISNTGAIFYDTPPLGKGQPDFELITRKSFTAPPRVLYRQASSMISASWGPGRKIAVLSGTHPPHTTGGRPRLLIVSPQGVAKIRPDGVGASLSNATWGPNVANIAITTWAGSGVVLERGHKVKLPARWFPASWNEAGTKLLVFKMGTPASIGVWSPAKPHTVQWIGALPAAVRDNQIVWLDKAPRL